MPGAKCVEGPYQSEPRTFPSLGVQALIHVLGLIEDVTDRTLPSPKLICMPPVWAVEAVVIVQFATVGACWNTGATGAPAGRANDVAYAAR